MVHKEFSKDAYNKYSKEIIDYIYNLATNYDHDEDAHRYSTQCFVCDAIDIKTKLQINIYWEQTNGPK